MSNQAGKRRSVSRGRPTAKAPAGKSNWAVDSLFNEGIAVLLLVLSLFLFLSAASPEIWFGFGSIPADSAASPESFNYMGRLGHVVGRILTGLMGACAIIPSLWTLALAVYFYYYETLGPSGDARRPTIRQVLNQTAGVLGVMIFCCGLASTLGAMQVGGALGRAVAGPGLKLVGGTGALVLFSSLLLISLALATRRTVADVISLAALGIRTGFAFFAGILPAIVIRGAIGGLSMTRRGIEAFGSVLMPSRKDSEAHEETLVLPKPKLRKNVVPLEEEVEKEVFQDDGSDFSRVVVQRRAAEIREQRAEREKAKKKTAEPKKKEALPEVEYDFPELGLLARGKPCEQAEDDQELREKSRSIEGKLKDFGIMGRVTHVHPGPVVTLFEFEPAAGVKVGRITAYGDDLAMALRASSIRIIAPIPRRGTVGIEVPNKQREIVTLRDVIESDAFQTPESLLTVAVGKDTVGEPVVADIARMPHLLMAGATGTGKSVCINSILISLLYRGSPKDLGLILIDPKILELSVYEGIPHLRVPVVTNPRQAKAVLQWAVNEMNRRYRLLQKYGVRSIDGYNKIVRGEIKPEDIPNRASGEVPEEIEEDLSVPPEAEELAAGEPEVKIGEKLEPLAKIVIVIDELADLMLAAGRDVEELITRLAQKARASGIHLILATQRPSVDVITGTIKANFPTRVSFRVSSKYDSRTILDAIGSEKLLGMGDMLFMVPGAEAVRRVHGAYVSDEEVNRVVAAIKAKAAPRYDEEIMAVCEKALEEENKEAQGADGAEEDYDSLYDAAVELVSAKGVASTSMIQRAFRIGYNRAARIMEMMEREGLVGPADGAKPREVIHRTEIDGAP